MNINDKATATTIVSKTNCASEMGSGSLDVFATPAMVALMEKAACEVINSSLTSEETTVGIKMDIEHIKATPIGDNVEATAVLTGIEGRKLIFSVSAKDNEGIIGQGVHERFIVNKEKFLSKLKRN